MRHQIKKKAHPLAILSQSENFMVVCYRDLDSGEKFNAVGEKLCINCDCYLYGNIVSNQKYGEQFQTAYYEEILPKDPDKIIEYLEYSGIYSLNRELAEKIVGRYGTYTFAALEKPQELTKIKDISLIKAQKISESYLETKDMRRWYELTNYYNISSAKTISVYKKFSKVENGYEIVKERPYLLCSCNDISFLSLDRYLQTDSGFSPYHMDRVRYGILYVLHQNEKCGHVFMKKKDFVDATIYQLSISKFVVNKQIIEKEIFDMTNQLVKEKKVFYQYGVLYSRRMFYAEMYAAKKIHELMQAKFPVPRTEHDVEKAINQAVSASGMRLAKGQRAGVKMALSNNVTIVTGGPGRGKTTVLKLLIESELLLNKDCRFTLVAPTGRASRKMTEGTGRDASTIHKLLGLTQGMIDMSSLPEIDTDVIISDESSMLDMELFCALLKAMKTGTRLILVGDKDQLPSVGAGNVFAELIGCRSIPITVLDETFRQAAGSSIISNSERVNENHVPLVWDDSTRLIRCRGEEETLEKVIHEVKRTLRSGRFHADQIQLLSPFREKTKLGARGLNLALQDILNPPDPSKKELRHGKRLFREGDRVIHLTNEEIVSNGDVGVIKKIDPVEKSIIVDFETNAEKKYSVYELYDLDHAYALTIHKSQGSEYAYVIIPFTEIFGPMRQRNLLYTAMTRAKTKVTIVGNEESVAYAAANSGTVRNTYLGYRIYKEKQAAMQKGA